MDKIIKIIEESKEGICKILYQNWHGQTYEAHVNPEEFKVRMLKQKLHFEMKIPANIVEEFERAVQDEQRENDKYERIGRQKDKC